MEVVGTLGCLELGVIRLLGGGRLTANTDVSIVELDLIVRLVSLLLALRLHPALRCGVLVATGSGGSGHGELAE